MVILCYLPEEGRKGPNNLQRAQKRREKGPKKIGFDMSCKFRNLHEVSKPIFRNQNKKNTYISNLLSAEFAQRVIKVNPYPAE